MEKTKIKQHCVCTDVLYRHSAAVCTDVLYRHSAAVYTDVLYRHSAAVCTDVLYRHSAAVCTDVLYRHAPSWPNHLHAGPLAVKKSPRKANGRVQFNGPLMDCKQLNPL